MKKIYVLSGPSGTGKDSILNAIVDDLHLAQRIVSFSSRPIRDGEIDGVTYHFISSDEFISMLERGEFIQHRIYKTLVGGFPDTWYYGMKDNLEDNEKYIVIVDFDGMRAIRDYFTPKCDLVIPIFIHTDDDIRRERVRSRGDYDKEEWNRRLESDKEVFKLEKVQKEYSYIVDNNQNFYKSLFDVAKIIQNT